MMKIVIRLGFYFSIWFFIENLLQINFNSETWSVLFVGFEAAFIGLTQIRNNRDNLEIHLFMKFNERYGNLNQDIKKLKGKSLFDINYDTQRDEYLKVLEDYINLSCEEYYCFKVKKQIPFEIWQFWHQGIMQNMKDAKCIHEFWESEFAISNSFYLNHSDGPFKIDAGRDLRSCFEIVLNKIEYYIY